MVYDRPIWLSSERQCLIQICPPSERLVVRCLYSICCSLSTRVTFFSCISDDSSINLRIIWIDGNQTLYKLHNTEHGTQLECDRRFATPSRIWRATLRLAMMTGDGSSARQRVGVFIEIYTLGLCANKSTCHRYINMQIDCDKQKNRRPSLGQCYKRVYSVLNQVISIY